MDKYLKNEKYKYLMEKLNKAIKNEFYYEAIFIIYAIMEDRTESLLKHANLKAKDLTLNEKLKKIQNSKVFQKSYVLKHLDDNLINSIYSWKHKRNTLIHDLIKANASEDEIKKIALDGLEIIKRLNNKSTLVTKYLDKNLVTI